MSSQISRRKIHFTKTQHHSRCVQSCQNNMHPSLKWGTIMWETSFLFLKSEWLLLWFWLLLGSRAEKKKESKLRASGQLWATNRRASVDLRPTTGSWHVAWLFFFFAREPSSSGGRTVENLGAKDVPWSYHPPTINITPFTRHLAYQNAHLVNLFYTYQILIYY